MALISEILNAALSDDGKALRVEVLGGIGGSNMRFLSGVTDPTPDIGAPGDVYLNTTSGDLFKNDNIVNHAVAMWRQSLCYGSNWSSGIRKI